MPHMHMFLILDTGELESATGVHILVFRYWLTVKMLPVRVFLILDTGEL